MMSEHEDAALAERADLLEIMQATLDLSDELKIDLAISGNLDATLDALSARLTPAPEKVVREAGGWRAMADIIKAEIDRQCGIGAGMAATCPETGLFQVSADLDIATLARAALAQPEAAPEKVVPSVWSKEWYAAADNARSAALREDPNDQMSALASAVDAAIACYSALAQPEAARVGEGFVLVPRDPTYAMLEAAEGVVIDAYCNRDTFANADEARAIWSAMLETVR